MTLDERRRFGIADALILIAGLAAGLGLVRAVASDVTPARVWEALVRPPKGWSLWYAFEVILDLSGIFVIPFVAAWTPACLLIQAVKPRPRRLRRRPGFVACLIASVVVTVTLAGALSVTSSDGYLKALLLGGTVAGSGVLSSWVTMRLCGVCRPSASWTDRLGRMTGAAWIALGTICAAYTLLALD